MKIAYITAGAAGSFCGSCMRDNTLVAALAAQGHDALLIPTYTPIRTDEPDVSQPRVFFGGINVYLQQKSALFRHTPWLFDRFLDDRRLLGWVSRFAVQIEAQKLGELTISMLKGEHGHQRKELAKLVEWLAAEVRPQIVNLTNVLLSGLVHEIKQRLRVPVLATLQGDDIYLESLPEPFRGQALELIRQHCREIDGFLTTSAYYADFMAGYLGLPRERIRVVYPGLNLTGHGSLSPPTPLPQGERGEIRLPSPLGGEGSGVRGKPPYAIGYFARICSEKGLHILAEAFHILKKTPGIPPCRLRVSGWLGKNNQAYFDAIQQRLKHAGLADDVEHVECPDHASKVRFLQSLDVFSVPTTYREPKGLYVLEALANGVPVVQPRHGSFPELIEATGGGLLVNPDDPADLARGLRQLLEDRTLREEMGRKGKRMVQQRFNAAMMAQETVAVYRQFVS